jgi:hypothetical protein
LLPSTGGFFETGMTDNSWRPYFVLGDYNRDGLVDASDYQQRPSQFGMSGDDSCRRQPRRESRFG